MNSFGVVVDAGRFAVVEDDGVVVVDDVSVGPEVDGSNAVASTIDGPARADPTSYAPADSDVAACALSTTDTGDVSCLPKPYSAFVIVGGGAAVHLADDVMELGHTGAVAFSPPSILLTHVDSAMIYLIRRLTMQINSRLFFFC